MKWHYLLIFYLLFLSWTTNAHNRKGSNFYGCKIDTLNLVNDSVFAKVISYRNDTVYKEVTAYLIHESVRRPMFTSRIPVFSSLGNCFKHKQSVIKLFKQGEEVYYAKNGSKIVAVFNQGQQIKESCYNTDGRCISRGDFKILNHMLLEWPINNEEYIIPFKKNN